MKSNNPQGKLNLQDLKQGHAALFEFFCNSLKELYWAENEMVGVLKKNKDLAFTEELMDALEKHERETMRQIKRLEKVFHVLDIEEEKKKCIAIEAMIKEANQNIKDSPKMSMTRDAIIIICSQKLEHYEIATYGSLVQIAKTFQMDAVSSILEKTLDEEEDTDYSLSEIALSFINLEAAKEDVSSINENNNKNEEPSKSESSAKKTKENK